MHDNILELKAYFKLKLILIQRMDEEDWIKLMYIQYITYSFSTTIGPHVCGSWNITEQKKIEKIMQCSSINSFLLCFGRGFFLEHNYYYAFIVKKWKNHTFLNEISSKNFKSPKSPRFNSCVSISYNIKKFTQEFHSQP